VVLFSGSLRPERVGGVVGRAGVAGRFVAISIEHIPTDRPAS
jgi:hypothetical protein